MEVADPSETLINSTTLHGVISRGSNIIGHCRDDVTTPKSRHSLFASFDCWNECGKS